MTETSTDSAAEKIPAATEAGREVTLTPRKIGDVSHDAELALLAELDAAIADAATSEEQLQDETDNGAAAAENIPEEGTESAVNSADLDETGISATAEEVPVPDESNDSPLDVAEADAATTSAAADEQLEAHTPDSADTATAHMPDEEEPGNSGDSSTADSSAGLSVTPEEDPVSHESNETPRDETEALPAEAEGAVATAAAPDEQLDADIHDSTDAAAPRVPEEEDNGESDDRSVSGDDPDAADDLSATLEDHHREEVPALLGREIEADDAEIQITPVAAIADESPVDARMEEDTPDTDDTGAVAEPELTDVHPLPVIAGEHTEPVAAPDAGIELGLFTESLQEVVADIRAVSAKIDAVSVDTDSLINQVNSLSIKYDALAEEIQANATDGATRNFLSKTFLTVSSVVVAALAVFQLYTFTSLIKSQRKEHAAVAALLGNMNDLNKKLADYDKNLTKALPVSAQPEHAPQQHHAAPEQAPHGTAGKTDTPSAPVIPVLEKMNRLRNGLPEKKLIRKETGDWFVYNKKNEECIADIEVIDALNQAYRKSGRSLSPGFPLPAHNALCILKPDGKGGTEIVMTKNFVP